MDLLTKINGELKHYHIIAGDFSVLCEDGAYHKRKGYLVTNRHNDHVEHSTLILPGAIFQAQHLDATLESLINPEPMAVVDPALSEDVVVN